MTALTMMLYFRLFKGPYCILKAQMLNLRLLLTFLKGRLFLNRFCQIQLIFFQFLSEFLGFFELQYRFLFNLLYLLQGLMSF